MKLFSQKQKDLTTQKPSKYVSDEQNLNEQNQKSQNQLKKDARIEKIPVAIRVTPILGNEFCERFAYYGLSNNLVNYYTGVLNKSNASASSLNSAWSGVCYVTPLIGSAFADDYLGRYWTMVVGSCIYIFGMLLLVFSSFSKFTPAPGEEGHGKTFGFFYFSLMVIALGTGFIKPVTSTFGADQLNTVKGKSSFFNWFYWAINVGALLSVFVVALQNKNWTYGFMVPLIVLAVSLLLFVLGTPMYRYAPTSEWPMKRFVKVVHRAIWNRAKYKKITPRPSISDDKKEVHKKGGISFTTIECNWLDWALESETPQGKMKGYTILEVTEVKLVMRLVPFLCSFVLYWVVYTQMNNLFVIQGEVMYQPPLTPVLGVLSSGQMSFFDTLTIIIGVPIYDKIITPGLARYGIKISTLMRIFLGFVVAIFAMVYPAIVEKYRRTWSVDYGYQMHILMLVPSYCLVGISEILASIGQIDFCYDQSPASMRSTMSALQLLSTGIGSFIASALTKVIQATTSRRGKRPGWIPDTNLDLGRLDLFFAVVAILMTLSTIVFVYLALTYKDKSEEVKAIQNRRNRGANDNTVQQLE